MSIGAPTHETVNKPAAAQETIPTAGTIDADESVIVDTQVITQTPLKPFPRFFVLVLGVTALRL